jgi:hypothetical protein
MSVYMLAADSLYSPSKLKIDLSFSFLDQKIDFSCFRAGSLMNDECFGSPIGGNFIESGNLSMRNYSSLRTKCSTNFTSPSDYYFQRKCIVH